MYVVAVHDDGTTLTFFRYIHRVTKTRSALQPEERGGGILADEMGMGKSLCLLALVLETLVDGRKWAEEKQQEEHHSSKIKRYSHSTLVIVPSARLYTLESQVKFEPVQLTMPHSIDKQLA